MTRFSYLLIYLLLLFKSGFFFNENLSSISAPFFIVLLLFFYVRYRRKTSNIAINLFMAILVFQHITYIFKGFPSVSQYILNFFNMFTVLLVVSNFRRKEFFEYFSNIVFLICIVSLCCVLLDFISFPLYIHFPLLTNSTGVSCYFIGLASIWSSIAGSDVNRMQGIFWEPGAFQTMIVFAMLIDMYREIPKVQLIKRILVYACTIVFTYSTTGYICLILLFAIYIAKYTRYSWMFLVIFGGVAFIAISSILASAEGFLYYTMFGKLEQANAALTMSEVNTASSRVESIIYPIKAFLNSPIVGIGVSGYEQISRTLGHSMFTCTAVNYFANYGLFCGVLHFIGFKKILRLKSKTIIESLLVIIILFATTMSEDFTFNPLLEVFMMYGFLYKEERCQIVNSKAVGI